MGGGGVRKTDRPTQTQAETDRPTGKVGFGTGD